MNVLSLFDGMSCGQLALKGIGITPAKYYAAEIDKFAMTVTQANFPDTIQLGDVQKISGCDLPKMDLLCGGSPCQGFSFAGKGLNFDDPRSKLFFEYVRILNECREQNPDIIFLLENVVMKREHQMVISKYLGVEPVRIDSNLLTAQNRDRLYWTNINTRPINLFGDLQSAIPQPKDRGIFLADVLEADVSEKYFVTDAALKRIERKGFSTPKVLPDKTGALNTRNNSAQMSLDSGTKFIPVADKDGNIKYKSKAACFTAGGNSGGNHSDMDLILEIRHGQKQMNEKAPTITANRYQQNNHLRNTRLRRLTPGEVCALQGVPKEYFFKDGGQIVSDTQIYKMLGNGWTVPVIEHIFSFANFK